MACPSQLLVPAVKEFLLHGPPLGSLRSCASYVISRGMAWGGSHGPLPARTGAQGGRRRVKAQPADPPQPARQRGAAGAQRTPHHIAGSQALTPGSLRPQARGAGEGAEERGPRILYKLHGSTAPGDLQRDLHLAAGRQGGPDGRRLRQAGAPSGLRFQSLGQLAGLEMVQLPHGQPANWLLRALQDHPGALLAALPMQRVPPQELPPCFSPHGGCA
jgi:hypothetical protein